MKLTPRQKKVLRILTVVVLAVVLTGCTVPRDADGNIKLIESTTTFSQTMKEDNWFNAILVWPLAQWINHMSPIVNGKSTGLNVGLSIAIVTIVVNGILALVTLKSTISTQEMQLIQPELEKIQRKYEGRDDESSRMRQAAETQKLYKEHNINPGGTMLVTFIQLPIIMAMYMAVQRSYSVAKGTFFGMDLQVKPWDGIIAAFKGDAASWGYLILFVFMGVCQYFSMRTPQILQKRRSEADAAKHHRKPETATNSQAKIMQYYMMAMILVFGLMWPVAMSLYWAINSLVNIVKTIIVQHIIDKRKAGKEGARA